MISDSRRVRRTRNSSRGRLLALALGAALAAPAAAMAAAPPTTTTTTSSSTTSTQVAPATTAPVAATTTTTTTTRAPAIRTTHTSSTTATTPATTTPTTTTPTTTTPTTTPTKPAPTPKPKPARATAVLYLGNLFLLHNYPVTVPGRAVVVTGIVRPYVSGQVVTVRGYLNNRLFKALRVRLAPSAHNAYGRFAVSLSSPGAGGVSVVVEHTATSAQVAFKARRGYAALNTNVGFGSTGRFVELVQQRLSAMHFYIPLTGVYDQGTGLAVDAYHRLLGWGQSQLLGNATVNALLNNVGAFHIRYPNQGRHAEGDLSDQLLALANGSTVYWILPISSGKPSTPTILGSYQVYSRVPGYLPDGMYYSDFFIRGYAIHGYDPAPDYPASHGCMRLPIVDAIAVYNWMSLGDWVDTYYT